MRSLKSKILCIVIAALLVTSVAISGVCYLAVRKIMQDNAVALSESVSREKAAKVNMVFKNIANAVHIVHMHANSALSHADQLQDETFTQKYTAELETLFGNIARVTDGVVCYYLRFAPERTQSPTSGFFYNRDMNTGSFYNTPPTDLSLYDPTDTERVGWYYEPVQAGHAIWMEPYYNQNNGIYMISYVIPMYHGDVLIGVVGMDVAVSLLTQAIDGISVYQNGFAYLSTADGALLYSPRPSEMREDVDPKAYIEASADLLNGMELTVRIAQADIQNNTLALLQKILLLLIVLSTAFIVVTVIIANRIIRPLKDLTQMAKELAEGKKVPAPVYNSKDEIGVLSRIFQETAEKLQDYMSYINALAYRDSLTGAKNRSAYTETVAELEKQMNRGRPEFGVLIVDVNDLKVVNDNYGHDVGDRMIIHTSRVLGGTFRYSPLFRIGGDEFLVILSGKDFENYRQLLKQLDTTCEQERISVEGEELMLSIARGVAIYDPVIDQTFSDVFQHADHAMYMHKLSTKHSQSAGKTD